MIRKEISKIAKIVEMKARKMGKISNIFNQPGEDKMKVESTDKEIGSLQILEANN